MKSFFNKESPHKLCLKVSALYQLYHFKKHTRFKLQIFYSHRSLEQENLLQNYPDFLLSIGISNGINCEFMSPAYCNCFVWQKLRWVGTEVSGLFKIIDLEVYRKTPQFEIKHSFLNCILGTYSAEIF